MSDTTVQPNNKSISFGKKTTREKPMGVLDAAKRKAMPSKDFALPSKKAFPLSDPLHDRLAISGATRSERAGNISPATADTIKAEARSKLGIKKVGKLKKAGAISDKKAEKFGL